MSSKHESLSLDIRIKTDGEENNPNSESNIDNRRTLKSADEIDELLNDNSIENILSSSSKKKGNELSSVMNKKFLPSSLPNYSKKYPNIRINKNSTIQTTNTVTASRLKEIKWDIWKESSLKGNHIILWEVWLITVHYDCYKKDLSKIDIKEIQNTSGLTASVIGGEKPGPVVITQGWTCQRCDYLVNNDAKEDSINWELCKSNIGCIVNSKIGKKSIWVHIQCIFWYSYMVFTSQEDKEEIIHDKTKFWVDSKGNKVSSCMFWHKQNVYALSCDIKDWDNSFWIRWASDQNIITDAEDMKNQRLQNQNETCIILWKDHIEWGRKSIKTNDLSSFKEYSIAWGESNSNDDKSEENSIDLENETKRKSNAVFKKINNKKN